MMMMMINKDDDDDDDDDDDYDNDDKWIIHALAKSTQGCRAHPFNCIVMLGGTRPSASFIRAASRCSS